MGHRRAAGRHGLPAGSGSVAAGQRIYDAKCASCHGTFGESNSYLQIAGGVGSLGSDQPVRTTGSKLNYATTLWDYINRAMPFEAPKTLTPDEVYALTAYVLNLNDILPADAVLDRDSLPRVKMPNRDGLTTAHGFMTRDGKPDTRNVACMKDCAAQVRLTSEMPDHARDQHGDARRASRACLPRRRRPRRASRAWRSARAFACTACHGISEGARRTGLPGHSHALFRGRRGGDRAGREGQGRRLGQLGFRADAGRRPAAGSGCPRACAMDSRRRQLTPRRRSAPLNEHASNSLEWTLQSMAGDRA